MSIIPNQTQILVIGGGPAGSTVSTLLARQGFDVILLERDVFPRYHIGESLLPSALQIFDLLGVREKIEAQGFQRKPGVYLQWREEQWTLNFGELSGNDAYTFQVDRAEFDHMLLEHAKTQGVKVFEGVEVRNIAFEGDHPTTVTWKQKVGGDATGTISFDFLLDASGRAGILSTRYFKNRREHSAFQNIAMWGYWKGTKRQPTNFDGDFEGALTIGTIPEGWLWAIPLAQDKTSIGVVMHKSFYKEKKVSSLSEIYQNAIANCPVIADMLGSGELTSEVKVDQDYSYTADNFSGPGYYLLGDAACFLDPLLSSGIHLATYSALLASASISSILRGEIDEYQGTVFYEKSYRQAYLRFMVFVASFYDKNRTRQDFLSEAEKLSRHDCKASDLKQAFLNLVSGMEDMSDVQDGIPNLVLGEVSKRLEDNLNMRKYKHLMAATQQKNQEITEKNAQFFDAIEGFFSLSKAGAVDGLYVVTEPKLGLAKVDAYNSQMYYQSNYASSAPVKPHIPIKH